MARFERCQLVDLYLYGMSIPEVSEMTGLARSTVRYHLLKSDVLRSRAEGIRNAGEKGLLGSGFRGKKRCFTQQHKDRIRAARLAHAEKHAKGVTLKPSGYLEYTRGEHKGRGVHRVIAERRAGRKLSRREHVHHIDERKTNNSASNLEVLTINEHARIHAAERAQHRARNPDGTWS